MAAIALATASSLGDDDDDDGRDDECISRSSSPPPTARVRTIVARTPGPVPRLAPRARRRPPPPPVVILVVSPVVVVVIVERVPTDIARIVLVVTEPTRSVRSRSHASRSHRLVPDRMDG